MISTALSDWQYLLFPAFLVGALMPVGIMLVNNVSYYRALHLSLVMAGGILLAWCIMTGILSL